MKANELDRDIDAVSDDKPHRQAGDGLLERLELFADHGAANMADAQELISDALLELKRLLRATPLPSRDSAEGAGDICAACGEPRREHTTPGGTRYGPQSLCSLFIPQVSLSVEPITWHEILGLLNAMRVVLKNQDQSDFEAALLVAVQIAITRLETTPSKPAPDAVREAISALEPFTRLGGGQNPRDAAAGLYYAAYYDLPGDTIVYANSGACITADDVRNARRVYKALSTPMSAEWTTANDLLKKIVGQATSPATLPSPDALGQDAKL